MADNPELGDIVIEGEIAIGAVKPTVGYTWLGFVLSNSSNVQDLIHSNLNKKKYNEAKFFSWLQMNESTPFPLKLRILYGCAFPAMLYSCEAWGDVSSIKESLLLFERKAIRACIGVKEGTSNEIIYIEIDKTDIIADILKRQYNFFCKFSSLDANDATAKEMWTTYSNEVDNGNTKIFIDYYSSLRPNTLQSNRTERTERLSHSIKSTEIRYISLFQLKYNNILYNSMINDLDRILISRWRLSSHKLYIETGRHKRPKIVRENRKCIICATLEDENHALFICRAHYIIRLEFIDLLKRYKNVQEILNPTCVNDVKPIAEYIRRIEKNMATLKMLQ